MQADAAEIERLKAIAVAISIQARRIATGTRSNEANAKATGIRSEADAESAKWFDIFKVDPDLAVFFFSLKALEETLKEKTTLILDERTSPFNLLTRPPSSAPNHPALPLSGNPK